jgi:hypothetical protein
MPYVVVDNFSAGLDSRRHVLNSKSGTLSALKNAHITRGGEIEKRKAFVQVADLSAAPYYLSQSYGLEATSDGIYVFGSAVAPASMPAGFIYQRLQHPVYTNFYDISKIVYSTVYGGKPFVIAEFPSTGATTITHRIAYYDGVAIKDWYEGYVLLENYVVGIQNSLISYFPVGSYTATSTVGNAAVAVTGPVGKSFTLTATVDLPMTATVATLQAHKEPVPEVLSKGSLSITGGSITAAYAFRGYVRYLDAASLPGIRSIRVGASSATANNGLDLIGWGSPTGLKYNTVSPTETTGSNGGSLCWNIRKAINDNTTSGIGHNYSSRWAWGGNWSGNDPNDLWIDAPPQHGSDANGLLVQIEFDANPAGIGNLSEIIDTATIAVSPYDPTKYIATFGVLSNGSFNRVNSVRVDGVEVLGVPVSWTSSHGQTAVAIAAQINSYTSSTEYTASVTDGSKVVITGLAGSGKTPNGKVISVSSEGNMIISGITSMSGGVDTVAGIPQISTITFTGPTLIPAGKKFGVTIIDPDNPSTPIIVGASRVVGKNANFSLTYKSKEYVGAGSTLYFSAINDVTKWDLYDTGSGFIDMSNNFGGREDLTGAGIYQNYLAVFSRRNVQLWSMDADPAQNAQVQVLSNTGALSPDSIVSVGSVDLLYLADNGVRSVRARESTDTAYANDIGSAIDSIIIEQMAASGNDKFVAKAVIEPVDGRYMLSIGSKIYVLSSFSGSNISAWSVYEPGFKVIEMVVKDDKVYLRDDANKIYVYGGSNGTTYDSSEVVVELPYLDANKPATYKEAKGIDATIQGTWQISMGFDHTNPNARDVIATPTQPTFALGKITATGFGTHFGLRMVNAAAGYARLANIIVHYDEMHSKHDAG